MAERTVLVRLMANITDYKSQLKKASEETDKFSEKTQKSTQGAGGKFAESFGRQVKAALASLPDLKITADSSAADREIAAVRSRLVELSGKTVGVDIDAGAATAEIGQLRARLLELGSTSSDIRVQVDAASASAQLSKITDEVSRLDGRSVTVDVNVDDRGSFGRARSGISGLASAALAISPALTSIGAVATAGIGAIGPLAVSGVAGLGVLALGFSGVADAAKLMGQRQLQVATDAAKSASSQATSISAVAAAEASLANTRANAGDAEVRARESVSRATATELAARRGAAEAVASAESNLTDARLKGARQVGDADRALADAGVDSARKVADARRALNDATVQGAREVRRATEEVAQAEQDAAADVQAALGDQEQAEDSLADAQRDSRRAQQDLTQARVDAREEMEDLQLSLRGGALAEREAVLDLEEARRKLAEVERNPAGDLAREKAVLNLEKMKLRLDEVRERNGDLATEQAEWARTGVEGSSRVLTAQERLGDAQGKVADATAAAGAAAVAVDQARVEGAAAVAKANENLTTARMDADRRASDAQQKLDDARTDGIRRVEDAQRTADDARASATKQVADAQAAVSKAQTDGAERVAAAQQAVTSAVRDQATQQRQAAFSVEQAQRAVETAMQAVGDTGESSLARINAQLAEVNPATLLFAGYVTDRLFPAVKGLQQTAAGGLLPGAQAGLETLMPYLPQLDGFVGKVAGSLGGLAEDGARALTNPFWLDFFTMIDRTAVPNLESLARTTGNVGAGFAGVLMAFEPMSTRVSAGIQRNSADFARWGAELGDSEGFRRFTGYVEQNWPKVEEIVGNVADMVGDLVEAGLPIGSAYLTGFVLLTDVLSGLPVGVVQALLVAFLGYRAVSGVAGLVTGIANSFLTVDTNIRGLPDKLSTVSDRITGIGSSASGALGVLGGPWGLVLAGATAAVGLFTSEISEATAQEDEWARGLVAGGKAATDAIAGIAAERAKYGDNWLGDLSYNVDQFFGLAASGDEARASVGALWREMDPLQQAQQKVAEWTATVRERFFSAGPASEEYRIAQERLAFWTGESATKQAQLDAATSGAVGTMSGAPAAAQMFGDSLDTLAGRIGSGTEATEALRAKTQEMGDGLRGFVDPLSTYTTLLAEKKEADRLAAEATAAATESSTDSWRDYTTNVGVTFDEHLVRLEEQVTAQDDWQLNMLRLSGRVSQGTIDELSRMGVEGAELVAGLVGASDAELDRFDDITYQRSKQATDAWGAQLAGAAPVLAAIGKTAGKDTVDALAAELEAGTVTVAEIAARYGINLAGGINPVLASLGKQQIEINRGKRAGFGVGGMANGGVLDFYARGGLRENHVAQIAPAGAWRVWAEEETGGEAYIPLSPAKRTRSVDIWRETGQRLGVDVDAYAQGSIVDFGRRLQGMGARVAEHPAFGGVAMGGHGKTSKHYTGDAIDVNTRGGTSPEEQRELAPMAALARSLGFRTIFMAPGHYGHLHVDTGSGGASIGSVGAPSMVELAKPPSTAPFGAPISTVADAMMQRAYDEATSWVAANTIAPEAGFGGASGGTGTGDQVSNARIIAGVARSMGFGRNGLIVALATALQESGLKNINYGDRDSVGLFQQRPSQGWGTVAQIMNPSYSAGKFFSALRGVKGWESMPVTVAAQRVQRSAFPDAYAKHVGLANSLASMVGYETGTDYVPRTGPAILHRGERVLTKEQNAIYTAREMPGRGWGGAAPNVVVQARVFVGNQEITDIARVEATAVVEGLVSGVERGVVNAGVGA